MPVDHRVFHQVVQHLLDQQSVHRDLEPLVGHLRLDGDLGEVGLKFFDAGPHDLLHRLGGLLQVKGGVAHLGDGEKVLNHSHHPLRLVPNIFQQLPLLLGAQVLLLHQGGGGARNGGQRRAQVVPHRAQQIGAQPLPFGLNVKALLLLDVGGHHAGHDGDAEQGHKGEGISHALQIKGVVGGYKGVIDDHRGKDTGQQAAQIPVCVAGHQKDRQDIDQGGVVVVRPNGLKQQADVQGRKHQDHQSHTVLPAQRKKVLDPFHMASLRYGGASVFVL